MWVFIAAVILMTIWITFSKGWEPPFSSSLYLRQAAILKAIETGDSVAAGDAMTVDSKDLIALAEKLSELATIEDEVVSAYWPISVAPPH